ncbi:hypothetical protein [Sulfurimonas sp.]|uniref:hypothetical protein n=1 Tax=Sulfurimonas sp. TaxID=2022749 RepID=UPI002B45A8F5|nr:hypothetical protein [Sulfurimonas sp.]
MKTSSIILERPRLFYFMIQGIVNYKNELIGFIKTSTIIRKQDNQSRLKSLHNKIYNFITKIWKDISSIKNFLLQNPIFYKGL